MDTTEIERIWASADYAPTARRLEPVGTVLADRVQALAGDLVDAGGAARIVDVGAGHGSLSAALAGLGHDVVAVEPTATIRQVGRESVPGVRWSEATGEETGLPDTWADLVVSAFGWMFADPARAVEEAARVLRPGGTLLFTAWSTRGFLADMTDRMAAAVDAPSEPPHMLWGREEIARDRLSPWFDPITVEDHDLPWCFTDVAEGMRLYREGSPTHRFSLERAGKRAPQMMAALEAHLAENADATGRIISSTGYVVVEARRRGRARTTDGDVPGR